MIFYGMQTEEGNKRIKDLVEKVQAEGGEVEDALQELTKLVKDPKFPEAMNTTTIREILVAFGLLEDPLELDDDFYNEADAWVEVITRRFDN